MTSPAARGRSNIPVVPFPFEPMLARLVRELPRDSGVFYEPKWDGFRCVVWRNDDHVDLRSRNGRPLSRYFPELVAALTTLPADRLVLDGEIVVEVAGRVDFPALLQRLHPAASRVQRLSELTPAVFIAFDLVAAGDDDLRAAPFADRRAALTQLFATARPPLYATPATTDPDEAEGWLYLHGSGIDGVVVKARDLLYTPGVRSMLKVKRQLTADCVVAGFRPHHEEYVVGSLLLGLYEADTLRHAGLAASFTRAERAAITADVAGHITSLGGHPWERGFNVEGPVGRLPGAASRWAHGGELTWIPLRPELVCEVAYDHLEGYRFRHPPRFVRWRHDRDPRSCTYDQFPDARGDVAAVLAQRE
jgi:ATP-dependent DNA ligase